MRRLPRSVAVLRHRDFRLLVGGQLASNFGDACYYVALPWYVLGTGAGPQLLATVLAAYGIPRTALIAVGGHLSDRLRPWTIMMCADVVRTAALAGLALAAAAGPAQPAVLLPIAIVVGAGEGLFLPGSFSIIPELLPSGQLQAGNALSSAGTQLATFVGPGLGGVLVLFGGSSGAFAADAGTFAVSAVTLLAIRRDRRPVSTVPAHQSDDPPAPPMPLRTFVRREKVLWFIFAINLAANLGSGGVAEVALPAFAHGPLHADAGGYGLLLALFGGGALAGTLLAGQLPALRKPVIIGSGAFFVEGAVLAVAPYLGSVAAMSAALAVVGFGNGFGNIMTMTAFQRWAPPSMLGRLMGITLLFSFGAFPVSVLIGGAVVHAFGPAVFFPCAGICLAVAILFAQTNRSWRDLGAVPTDSAITSPNTAGPTSAQRPVGQDDQRATMRQT